MDDDNDEVYTSIEGPTSKQRLYVCMRMDGWDDGRCAIVVVASITRLRDDAAVAAAL
jgi:hypothetical protein